MTDHEQYEWLKTQTCPIHDEPIDPETDSCWSCRWEASGHTLDELLTHTPPQSAPSAPRDAEIARLRMALSVSEDTALERGLELAALRERLQDIDDIAKTAFLPAGWNESIAFQRILDITRLEAASRKERTT